VKTLILGLGNPILGDDAVGVLAARRLKARLAGRPGVDVDEEYHGGLRLMERLAGYDRAVLIDALCTGARPPGAWLRLGPGDLPTQHTASAHDVNLPTALRLAAAMGLKMPADIAIFAVEAERVLDFSEECTPAVAAAVPDVVEAVLAEVR
jgi:hydrogenase maturation protease